MKKKVDNKTGEPINHKIELTKGDKMYYKNKDKDVKFLDVNSGNIFRPDIQELFIKGQKV